MIRTRQQSHTAYREALGDRRLTLFAEEDELRKLVRMSILTALLLIAALFGGCGTMQTAHAGETIPPPPIRIMQVVHAPGRVTVRSYRAWWSDATYRGMQRVSYQRYPIYQAPRTPVGSWSRTLTRGGLTHIIRYPVFVRPVVRTVQSANRTANMAPVRGYTDTWLVTYYLATGSPMANGVYPSVGWAACGNEVPLGARVAVSGYGTFICGDRIGADPYRHIDIFGIPLGTHTQQVTVYR